MPTHFKPNNKQGYFYIQLWAIGTQFTTVMGIITNSLLIDILLSLTLVIYLMYGWIKEHFAYWDKRNVPNIKGGIVMAPLIDKCSQSEATLKLYNKFSGKRFAGFFQIQKPMLMVRDVELIHKVMVKDFIHFEDRGQPEFKSDPLSWSLLNSKGQFWRALRNKLTPTFSTGRLKGMFEQVSKCGDHMLIKLEKLSKDEADIETKMFVFEFTLDVISSCAFGLQFKPNTPEFEKFKTFTEKLFKATPTIFLRFGIAMFSQKLTEMANLTLFGKEVGDYFLDLVKQTSKYRKENNIQRNDYFQLLLTLREQEESGKDMGLNTLETHEDDAVINQMQYTEQHDQSSTSNIKLFSDEVICANSFIFLLAGSETVSSTISFALFNLSQDPEVQRKLQKEVDCALSKHGGSWSYETIKEMTYLDQVIQESQRLYPSLSLLIRECVKDYKVPDSDLVIEKGVLVGIPVIGLHLDPQNYPEPEKFLPERFEGNNFKPSSIFLPFGDGPRICIGMRFALMEVKTCIARIMSQYSVKPNPKTQYPLSFDPQSFTLAVKGGIYLSFEKRMKE